MDSGRACLKIGLLQKRKKGAREYPAGDEADGGKRGRGPEGSKSTGNQKK